MQMSTGESEIGAAHKQHKLFTGQFFRIGGIGRSAYDMKNCALLKMERKKRKLSSYMQAEITVTMWIEIPHYARIRGC